MWLQGYPDVKLEPCLKDLSEVRKIETSRDIQNEYHGENPAAWDLA